jgi:hypothetical protein
MLLLVLIASCAVLVSSSALARADKESPPNTIDCAAFKKTPNGNWYVGPPTLSTLGRSKQSGLGTILLFRMIRIRVSAELTCTTS